MANHLHKQLRDAILAALTGLATTGARAYATRSQPMAEGNLPGLRIYLDEERAEAQTIHAPVMQGREAGLVVEACAKAGSALDDTLDQVSKEVEIALAAGITVAGRSLEVSYTGMSFSVEQLEQPVGVKRMTFSIPFSAMSNAPDVLI